MTSLLDTVNQNKKTNTLGPGGTLQAQSTQGIQSLSSSLGQAIPTDPLSTQTLTGNPDQSKMAGTSNQLQAANSINLSGSGTSLTQYDNSQKPTSQATQTDLNSQVQVKQMEQLGDLAPRVQQLINLNTTQAAQAPANATPLAKTGLTPELTQALNSFAQGDKTQLPLIAKALNKDVLNLNYDDLVNLYQDQTGSVANSIAQAMPDQIKVSQSLLGDNISMADLSQLLGKDVSTLTIDQLGSELDGFLNKAQSNISQIKAKLADPKTSQAERTVLNEQLRSLGQTGEEGTAQLASDLDNQIQSGLTVQFNGKQYTVSELLSDSNISQLVTDYINSPTGPAADELNKLSPALIDFIKKNQDAFKQAADQVNTNTTDVKNTITTNRAISNTASGPINDDLMAAIYGDNWKDNTTALDPNKSPVIAYLNDKTIDPNKRAALSNSLNTLSDLAPNIAKSVLNKSPAELEALGLTLNPADPNSALAVYKLALGMEPRLQALDPNEQDPEKLLEAITGQDINSGVGQGLKDYELAKSIGLSGADQGMDQLESLMGTINKYKSMDINDLGSVKNTINGDQVNNATISANKSTQYSNNPVLTTLKPYLADGKISTSEINDLLTKTSPSNALNTLTQLGPKAFDNTQDVEGAAQRAANSLVDQLISSRSLPASTRNVLDNPYGSNNYNQNDLNALQSLKAGLISERDNPTYNDKAKALINNQINYVNYQASLLAQVLQNKADFIASQNSKPAGQRNNGLDFGSLGGPITVSL